MKKFLCILLTICVGLSLFTMPVFAQPETTSNDNPLRLWYTTPAPVNTDSYQWQSTVLPIGNGYMGGMVFGGISRERVHFNEKTMWTGGPAASRPNYNGCNRLTNATLEQINSFRTQLDDKSQYVFGYATKSASDTVLGQIITGGSSAYWSGMGMYQDFGDIYLDFTRSGLTDAAVSNYVRDLDLNTALASVSYDFDDVTFKREYFNSYPDNVLVMRLTANESEKLTFDASISPYTGGTTGRATAAEDDLITYTGRLTDNGLNFEAQLKVLNEGGDLTANANGTISVTGADEVVLLLACGTDYVNVYPAYRGALPHAAISGRIEDAAEKGYEDLLADHLADYQELFSRVKLDLDADVPDIPTNQLVANYQNGDYDKALEVMAYQMGRYLTIAGSRENALPTNLNGVWMIGSASQFWNADYHMNVNFQMNYWPTMGSNLAECMLPHNDYIETLRVPGRVTAGASAAVPSAEGEENGFLFHTVNNIFGVTGAYNVQEFGWNMGGSSWVMQNVYDYYCYTLDEEYLRDTIYPMLKEMATFWSKFLWYSPYQQRLVVGPSVSAEQGPTTNGTTYDQSIAWEALKEAAEAADILGVDAELAAEWRSLMNRINPILIGDEGQIKEWYEETTIGKAKAGNLPEISIWNFNAGYAGPHRHISHLVGLYPGTAISKETPEFLDAAHYSLLEKGFEATGWSKAHKINAWARTGDSENTYKLVKAMVGGGYAGFMTNLLASHGQGTNHKGTPVFQIDGNFGFTAGINEMLVQSQLGYVQLLPAIPEEWSTGNVSGIVARGNFVLDMDWNAGTLCRADVTARAGGKFIGEYTGIANASVKDSTGNTVPFTTIASNRISFDTAEGETYTITFDVDNYLAAKLREAIETTQAVADALDEEALAVVKGQLNGAVLAAEQAIENALTDTYVNHINTLKALAAKGRKAVELYDAIPLGEATLVVYELLANPGNALESAYNACKASLETANGLLNSTESGEKDLADALIDLNAKRKAFADLLVTDVLPVFEEDPTGTYLNILSPVESFDIYYTRDGVTAPGIGSLLYTGPIEIQGLVYQAALFYKGVQIGGVAKISYVGGNIAPTATTVTHSNQYSASYAGRYATDGNMGTRWATADSVTAAWLELEFPGTVKISGSKIIQYPSATNYINAYSILYWADDEWKPAVTVTDSNLETSFAPVSSNKIKLDITGAMRPSIWEFELYAAATGGEVVYRTYAELQELIAQAKEMEKDKVFDGWVPFEKALLFAENLTETSNLLTITDAYDALKGAMNRLVPVIPVASLKINSAATTTVRKNKTLQLAAIFTPVNANTGTDVVWSTSNPASVKVNEQTGLITGVKAGGSARVTATTSNGKTYTITVTVDS